MKHLTLLFLFIFNFVYAQTPKQIKSCIDTCKTVRSLDLYWSTLEYPQKSNPINSSYFKKKYKMLPRDSSYYSTPQTNLNLQDSIQANLSKFKTQNINLAGTQLKKAANKVLIGILICGAGVAIIAVVPTAYIVGILVSTVGSGYALSAWINIYNAGELLERHY